MADLPAPGDPRGQARTKEEVLRWFTAMLTENWGKPFTTRLTVTLGEDARVSLERHDRIVSEQVVEPEVV